jgi:ribosomal protein S17
VKKYYSKYLPSGKRQYDFEDTSQEWKKGDTVLGSDGHYIYTGNKTMLKASLFLCSTEYKVGDRVVINYPSPIRKTKFVGVTETVTLVSSGLSNQAIQKKCWLTKEMGDLLIYEEGIGVQHFKVMGLVSEKATWVSSLNSLNDDDRFCQFDESDVKLIDSGIYAIKCPTSNAFH